MLRNSIRWLRLGSVERLALFCVRISKAIDILWPSRHSREMGTLFLNGIIFLLTATLLAGCDATTTTQNGAAKKSSSSAASTGARQTGTHMR